jgi:hypothetical protein
MAAYSGEVSGAFGQALVRYMAERNLSTLMLSAELGCSVSTISSWVRGVDLNPTSPAVYKLKSLCPQVDWIGLASAQADSVFLSVRHLPPDSWIRSVLAGIALESAVAEGSLKLAPPKENPLKPVISYFSDADGWAIGYEEGVLNGRQVKTPILITRTGVKRGETSFVFKECRWVFKSFPSIAEIWVLAPPEGIEVIEAVECARNAGAASVPWKDAADNLRSVVGWLTAPFWIRGVIAAEWPTFFREWVEQQRLLLFLVEQQNIPAPRA